ncbi:MAG: hypothetical protein FWE67_08715 [Planctomycetaceae bacterium]|nr:hypothetical protein [Planctomycetaceae bacterium]
MNGFDVCTSRVKANLADKRNVFVYVNALCGSAIIEIMRRIAFLFAFLSVAGFVLSSAAVYSQEEGTAAPRLAPGSLITVPPDLDYSSAYNRADLTEVLATLDEVDPELKDDVRFNPEMWAKDVRFFRDVWCLQFSFKPLRIIYVDIPNKEGTFTKKAVWYLLYNVKNPGPAEIEKESQKKRTININGSGTVEVESSKFTISKTGSIGTAYDKEFPMPVAQDTVAKSEYEDSTNKEVKQNRDAPLVLRELRGFFEPVAGEDKPIHFVPQFTLATDKLTTETTSDINVKTGKLESAGTKEQIQYVDQVIPVAIGPIMRKEGMSEPPKTAVSIAAKELASGDEIWGIAMWTDIDPRINKFSIYVSGLTNEYRWTDAGNATGNPGEGRTMTQKYLKTNWWRRGDRYTLESSQIQLGQPGTLDYEWIFR